MKFRYDKQDDVLMIWFSKEPIDYAEQNKDIIVHFSKKNKPILIEILEASSFFRESSKVFPQELKKQMFVS